MARRSSWGEVEQRGARSVRALYTAPNLKRYQKSFKVLAGESITGAKMRAKDWLNNEYKLVEAGTWTPPEAREEAKRVAEAQAKARADTLSAYAKKKVGQRMLSRRTRDEYKKMLKRFIDAPLRESEPALGSFRVTDITSDMVGEWHQAMGASLLTAGRVTPRQQSLVYGFLHSVFEEAVEDDLIV
ncbi:MAG: hypothetical protein LBC29_05410, partial [Propionibacteriaceae bacterium]|nr:hypothetical protein [Propionibacteriaceae bacterium]